MTFADDFTVTGKVDEFKLYRNMLQQVGPLYEYFPFKSNLIVKEYFYENAKETFKNSEVKLTKEGQKHLIAIIGSDAFKESFIKSLAEGWIEQLKLLSTILQNQCHKQYTKFLWEGSKGSSFIS